MKTNTGQDHQQAGAEDILLALLGLIAGPLLWWISQSWKSQPAASSMQTLEYWIALICGFIGVALATVWLIFLLAGVAFLVGLKTRQAALTYWAELFTPKFLRRILVSIVGVQLALASQAVASPDSENTPLETPETPTQNAFMPHVEIPSAPNREDTENSDQQLDSPTPSPEGSNVMPSSSALSSHSSEPDLVPKPRETSSLKVTPSPTPLVTETPELVAAPRQTSTIPVESDLLDEQASTQQPSAHQSDGFTPQPVPMSPHIAVPPQPTDGEASTVVVKAGDCLWDIAHYELGAEATLFQIDRRWRQWWEFNATVIGDDPHTIQPGTVLEAPPFTD